MKVKVKRPISIDGVFIHPGIHDLDNKLFSHWFMEALINEGRVDVLEVKPQADAEVLPEPKEEQVLEATPLKKKRPSKKETPPEGS